jgi:O-antigen ligase
MLLWLRAKGRWGKLAFTLVTVTAIWVIAGSDVSVNDTRAISPQRIASSLESVVGAGSENALAGSREWRLRWWGTICDYTFFGPYFWFGKGFGVNLADDDGFQVLADSALRSPHSAHLNILARTGVPGLALWIALQVAFGARLIGAARLAVRRGEQRMADNVLWVLVYWSAFLLNMSFDLTLEGPHGGIWFWCLIGVGLCLAERCHSMRPSTGESAPPLTSP